MKTNTVTMMVGLILSIPSSASALRRPTVWTISSLERVGPKDSAPNVTSHAVHIYAARGEYEAFQIVINSGTKGFSDVNVRASDLICSENTAISSSNVSLYREQYVNVLKSSPNWNGINQPLGPGWYADGLIPFVDPDTRKPLTTAQLRATPFDIDANTNQPIWVEVFVPRTVHAGRYTGQLTISNARGWQVLVTITAHVWDFEMPVKPHLLSSFGYSGQAPDQAARELLRHKVMPQVASGCRSGGSIPCPGNPTMERDLNETFGLSAVDLHFWSGADFGHCRMSPPPSLESLEAARLSHWPDLTIYNFTADEINQCPDLFDILKRWARRLHEAGVLNLVTMSPRTELYDDGIGEGRPAVDIWVLLPIAYDQSMPEIADVRKLGAKIWSYNCAVQDAYSPKWQIDFPLINYRIQPGFISQSLALTGLLYWRTDQWSGDPWSDSIDNTGRFHPTSSYPGEGFLVYPGAKVGVHGVVASMRLKQIREGIEDYEYIERLKELGRGEWALHIAHQVGADWTHWTRDPNVLFSARRQLGDEIDRLTRLLLNHDKN